MSHAHLVPWKYRATSDVICIAAVLEASVLVLGQLWSALTEMHSKGDPDAKDVEVLLHRPALTKVVSLLPAFK